MCDFLKDAFLTSGLGRLFLLGVNNCDLILLCTTFLPMWELGLEFVLFTEHPQSVAWYTVHNDYSIHVSRIVNE